MKIIKTILAALLFSALAKADDTASLQSMLNAGPSTLVSGKTYYISQPLSVSSPLNMNGATIKTSQVSGAAILLYSGSISNGTVQGSWNSTMAANPSGNYGIRILGSGVQVSYMVIEGFPAYGILCSNGTFSNLSIMGNVIRSTGYVGFFFDPEASGSTGNVFSYNTIDRSMLPGSTIKDACVDIRASTNNPAYSTSNWTISGNTFKMPVNPASTANECMEVRYMTGSVISGNVCTGGSIALSVVRSKTVLVSNNKCFSQNQEGIEFASSEGCNTSNNYISGSLGSGILLDGYSTTPSLQSAACNIVLNGDTVLNPKAEAVHVYYHCKNITANGLVVTVSTKGFNIEQADSVYSVGTKITGLTPAAIAYMLDTAPGHLFIQGGQVSSCSNAVFAYSAQPSAVVDYIFLTGTILNTSGKIGSYFLNGAHLGTNIKFQ